MEKNTIIAIVLSVVIISAGFMIQNAFFAPKTNVKTQTVQSSSGSQSSGQPSGQSSGQVSGQTSGDQGQGSGSVVSGLPLALEAPELSAAEIHAETDVFDITFSNKGGVITSLKLKEHIDGEHPLEMIKRGNPDQAAFTLSFGTPDSAPIDVPFTHKIRKNNRGNIESIEFERGFVTSGVPFTLRKTYLFHDDDYMVELRVGIENSVKDYPNINQNGWAYSLGFGPQIGPEFTKLDGRYEYRNFYSYTGGKKTQAKLKGGVHEIFDHVSWAALAGKYFAVIAVPDATQYRITFSNQPVEGLKDAARMYFSRPLIKSSKNEDVFRFYMGPKASNELSRYNSADKNGFGLSGLSLEKAMDSGSILGWLEWILQKILQGCYFVIPNYGVAILLLTFFIKAILYPLTKKSVRSTSRMQGLSPKIAELQKKHKDNPQRLNQEMAELYKREGISPLSGCLPLLLQMPIFFALYGLLNKHFELRGAMFIPGWITDLSAPESIFNFAPLSLPFIKSDIRLLPILFVATQIVYGKMTASPDASGAGGMNMKLITYAMPIVFFFILYDAPSGLLVYWIATNVLSGAQQIYINKKTKKKAVK
jgi:YidC/Oxa1 family membrane protein insertase